MTRSSLHKGWRTVKFGDLAESITERVDDPKAAGVEIYVGLEHLDSDTTKISRFGTPEDVESTKLRFYPGDVIYARRRAYQRKLGVAEVEGICSAHALVLRARREVCLPEFLPYFLQSDQFHERALSISVGSLSPTINWKTLVVQEFVLPPIAEQHRIVELVSSIDQAITAYQSADFSKQIKSIIEDFELSAGAGWKESTLGEIADFINGYPFKPADLGSSGTPVIRIKQLLDPNEKVDRTLTKVAEKYFLKDGDIVFSWSATLAVRLWDRGAAVLNQHLFRVEEKSGVLHEWLPIILNHAIEELLQKSHGTTMKHITKQSLLPHKVTLPPIDEQKRLVGLIGQVKLLESKCEESVSNLISLRSLFINDFSSSVTRHV